MNHLLINQKITAITFQEEWQKTPVVIYPAGLGAVRDLIDMLPMLKKLKVTFFFSGAKRQNYEAVQILSSLGICSGVVIKENADWERLTDLMYYALCGKAWHAPIEPFQYVYEVYSRNTLVNYGKVFSILDDDGDCNLTAKDAKEAQRTQRGEPDKSWQRFFYEGTACAACEGWRICLGKYAGLKDKSGCKAFTAELLNLIESIKFKKQEKL